MADPGCRGYLISIKNNGENGARLPISVDTCYIGANAECEVRLRDADFEDRHCLIKFSHSKHAIIYGLCNEKPVLLNDEYIGENGTPLKNGDIIQIIDVKFKWEENNSFVDTEPGRFSMNVEKNSSEELERKRFSEPAQTINRENLIEDQQKDEPHPDYNNITCNEKKDETKVTSETTPFKNSLISSPSVKTAISSCGNNRSNYNRDSHNQSENNSSRDVSQTRRSRQFCPTYKTKSIANTPDNKKTTSSTRFFKNTPLQENNRTLGREVKSRFFENRNSSTKLASSLSFVETSKNISVLQNGDSNHMVSSDNLEKEVENIVPINDADIEFKENTLGNETNAVEATFETTVPSDMVEAPSSLTGLATPKCFTNAFHSTPKAPDLSKSELASNLEANETTNISSAISGPDEPTKIYNLENNSILASPVKAIPGSDVSCKKRVDTDLSRMEPDSLSETRRHHTRSTSNILKKTFEECSEDNLPMNEKSLTTPEKSTNECGGHSRNPALNVEESELDSYSPEKKVDSRKCVSGSIRSPMLESTSELSAENGDAVSTLSSEVRDKSLKHDDSSMMAKCSRNLSSFSPPENNRSQEYMDSVVVSTPKKSCPVDDEESLSTTAVTPPAKDLVADAAACITPKTPTSPTRHRRSTGIVPCVGTPSDVYRTTKGGFTPGYRSRFNRTSMEVEVSMGPRDSLSSIPSKLAPKRSSSERKSTPLKADKSVARDSLQTHSPIVEEYDLENEESQNESPNNDSQFQFVSKRRRRLAKSSFAIEERILEESEIISSDFSNEEDDVIDEEGSLVPLESFDDNAEFGSTRIVVNRTTGNDTENGLNSTFTLDSSEEADDGTKLELTMPAVKPALPKSILTPLPRHAAAAAREKSAKKVTFFNLKEDSLNVDASVDSMTDLDGEYELHLSSRANSSADISSVGGENCSLPKTDSDDERLYLSDKSSDAYSFNDSAATGDSIVQRILAKRNKSVKRLSAASSSKSPKLSGIRRLMNPQRSPKCDYTNVSGVKQLMKTPESLVKPVKKPSLKIPKTPSPLKEAKKTPESRKSPMPIAKRQSTPAPFGKSAKTPEALAECLNAPKALMVLATPPRIIVEFVETPKRADVSAALSEKEVGESTPGARRKSHAGNGDTATPTTRRCSKHFRIHRSSLCMLASSVNSTLNETLSPHDCSASLENSIAEQNDEVAENEIMPPPQNPEVVFKDVLVELKEKLRTLNKTQADAVKDVLETSINTIDEVLNDEPVPDSDTGVAEKKLENVLLELKRRFSYSDKFDENNESAVERQTRSPTIPKIDIKEQSILGRLNENDLDEASQDSYIDESIVDASQGGAVVDSTEHEEVVNNECHETKSEEIQSSVSDAVEKILSHVCDETKTNEISENIHSLSKSEETPGTISMALHSDKDVSCVADVVESVNSAIDTVHSEDFETNISDATNSIEMDPHNSLCAESEGVLSATDDLSQSVDAYHSTVEFKNRQDALVEKETIIETIDEEPQVDTPTSEAAEVELSQKSSISHIVEVKEQRELDASVFDVNARQLPESIVDSEEQEIDSENLELFVSDNEMVMSEPKLTTEEKSNSEEQISNVTNTTVEADKNDTDSLLATTTKSSLPENSVEETESNKSTIPANENLDAEKVRQKSFQNNSAVSNDTFKTCSLVSNLTLTSAEVEESEKVPKILDAIIAHDKSKLLLDVSTRLLVHDENKENLLSLTPIAASAKEKSILQNTEKTPAPSTGVDCDVTESLFLTLVADTPNMTKRLDSSILSESDAEKNIVASEKSEITPAKSSCVEKDASISLNSSYPTDPELDATREENLSCIEPSMNEMKTVSEAETSINATEESRATISSCETDEERSTDASSERLNSSQTSSDLSEMPPSSEGCTATLPSEVSSSVSDYVEVPPVVTKLPDLSAQLMVTPRRCTAVCVSIESQDQLTLAGPKIVTQTVGNSKSISTSTPILSAVAQTTMEIPQSCSTTIDPSPPSEDEAAELSSESSETIIDDKHETVDSSDESPSKEKTALRKVQDELVSDVSAVSQPADTVCDQTDVTVTVEKESHYDSELTSVSQETGSVAVSQELVEENDSEVPTDYDEATASVDVTEEVVIPVKRPSRNLSVVIQDAKDSLPSSQCNSPSLEAARKNVVEETSVNADNVESTRPKRGRPTKRYTELFKPCYLCLHDSSTTPKSRYSVRSKGESSTQSSKRTKITKKAAASNVLNVSVELERLEMPLEDLPAKATQRKTVHFNMEAEADRPTRPRELVKIHVPTPKRRRTVSKPEDSDVSPVDQFGSPCSIIIPKMDSSDENSTVTTKDLPKRASRSRSVAPKEKTRTRPSRAASCLADSTNRMLVEPKRGRKVKEVEPVLTSKASAKEVSRRNGGTSEATAPKPKDITKATKSTAKNKKKPEVADLPEEEKRSKRKVADEVVQSVDAAGSSKSGSKGKREKESSKAVEVPAESERKSRRTVAEAVEATTTKGKKNASKAEEPVSDAKPQNEVPAKAEKLSRQKVVTGVEKDEKNENTKASKRTTKGAKKNEVSETVDDSNASLRATRQRKAAQPVVEVAEPPKTAKRAKVDLSAETATTSRATRGRKDAVETCELTEKNSKSTRKNASVAPETSKSKATKRVAAVVLDSIDEVVRKKRRQSPDPVPAPAKTKRNKKNEVVGVTSELRITLEKQKTNEKENKPASTKILPDEKPVKSAASKKKRDPTPTENVRLTRAAKVKEVPQTEGSIVAAAATSTRVTRSQNISTLSVPRRAKK